LLEQTLNDKITQVSDPLVNNTAIAEMKTKLQKFDDLNEKKHDDLRKKISKIETDMLQN
jgi:hypothetical protein